ncbi:MAG: hyaluronan synthase [Desulforhopalus sp.]|jgi:hyaluronan synthase
MQSIAASKASRNNCRISILKYSVFLFSFVGLAVLWLSPQYMLEFQSTIASTPWIHPFAKLGFCIMIATVLYYLILAYNAFRYKPIPGASDQDLPTVTVVVPAYNEGALVLETLRSLATGDFPQEKIQLIAVDDGSKDQTWSYIVKAAQEFPGRIVTIRQITNAGKRRALYEGFKQATGDVLVTVDSDSVVNKDTLRNLVSPFVGDPDCGAVAGNVRVLNREAVIPRMLEVSFVFSFEFVRSAQSVLRTVFCTPGALAAYRRDLVMNVIEEWVNQTFLGREANIGEDRAITNLILRQGKSVLFQRNAMVYTNVPEQYQGLCKMLIRWGRSNVRESLKMGTFIFKRFRSHHRTSARILWFIQCLWCGASPFLFLLMLALIILFPLEFFITSLGGGALWCSFSAIFYTSRYRSSEALWAYGYGIFHFCALAWITPYALLTLQKTGWLTRDIPLEPSIAGMEHASNSNNRVLAVVPK